jgi:protease-4
MATMFSRRHPYLFFLLTFTAMISASAIVLSLLGLASQHRSDIGFGQKVGVIEITGVIADSRKILEQIRTFRKNSAVKSIVVRIDSPGGGVGPSQEIYQEIRKTVAQKKVIASMGGIAASGGYYIAAAADGIVANPGTITGSIGVILGYTNFEQLFQKIGLRPVVVKSGEYKDIASPVRDMTDAEKEILQNFSDTVHAQFIDHVAEARQLPAEEVRKFADGRIFSGETAKDLKLIDRLGNFEDAVEWAGRLGGITGDITTVYPPEEKLPFLKYLVDAMAQQIKTFLAQKETALLTDEIAGGYVYQPAAGR